MVMLRKIISATVFSVIAASLAHAEDTIKIGGLLETSGPVASLGQPALNGAQLAVDEINAAGGIKGKKVQLININSESDNTKTVSAARRLIFQEKVIAIIGPASTGSNMAIVDSVERSKIPMIGIGATRGIVLPPEKRKYTFLAPLTDGIVVKVMLHDMQQRGIKKIAVLNSDVAFGTGGFDMLNKTAGDYNIRITDHEVFGNADTDMTPQLTKIRASDAQATVIWGTGAGPAIATKNYRALDIKAPLYLSHAANDFNYLRLSGDAANGILLPSSKIYITADLPDTDPQKKVIAKFVSDYQSKFNTMPATFSGNGYDAAMLIMHAIATAGEKSPAIRDAIEQTKNYIGITANYSYSPINHFGTEPESVEMLTVKNSKFGIAK